MRIGIDCRVISKNGGAGISLYAAKLVSHLLDIDQTNRYVLFFEKGSGEDAYQRSNTEIVTVPGKGFLPLWNSHFRFTLELKKRKIDIFHGPANVLPLGYKGNSVVTVHDLAIYRNPEWFPPQTFSTKVVVPRSLAKARALIAVSESTKKDLRDIFQIFSKRVRVVYEGIETKGAGSLESGQSSVKPPYFLFIGTLEPRKNISTLLHAYGLAVSKHPDFPRLVLAGAKGWKSESVFSTIEHFSLGNRVKYLGYVSDKQKQELLAGSSVFLYPSLYEGFGLPILEAFVNKVPVLTSHLSSMPEVAGDAALYVDPNDPQAIADSLVRILTDQDLRKNLVAKGLVRVKQFNWKKTAQETLKVYEQVAQNA